MGIILVLSTADAEIPAAKVAESGRKGPISTALTGSMPWLRRTSAGLSDIGVTKVGLLRAG